MVKITRKDGTIIEVTVEELKEIGYNSELYKLLFEEKVEGPEIKPLVKLKNLGEVLEEFKGKDVRSKDLEAYSSKVSAILSNLVKKGKIQRVDWGLYHIPDNFSASVITECIFNSLDKTYERIKESGKRIGECKKIRATYEAWTDNNAYYLFRINRDEKIVGIGKFTYAELENPPSYKPGKLMLFNILKKIINTAIY
jgi:hypothetical protein